MTRRCVPAIALWKSSKPLPDSSDGVALGYAPYCRFSTSAANRHGIGHPSPASSSRHQCRAAEEIFDQWGRFVSRADLWLVGTRRIHEYDGDLHRDRQAHRNDLARDRRLVEIDFQRMGFTSSQLLHEGASIIASADPVLARCWNPKRLGSWEALLDDSLFPTSWPAAGNGPLATRDVTSGWKVWASDKFSAQKFATRPHFLRMISSRGLKKWLPG